jgi:dephospho-CoA kinase
VTHPRISASLTERLQALARRPPKPPIVILEAAILVEAGWAALVDRVIVVSTQPSTQIARLIAGSKMDASQAEARIRAQIPLHQRLRHAHYRLDGEAPLEETRLQVAAIWADLLRQAS